MGEKINVIFMSLKVCVLVNNTRRTSMMLPDIIITAMHQADALPNSRENSYTNVIRRF